MIYSIRDGDKIKILPFIEKNNKVTWGKQYDIVMTDSGPVYDDKGYLKKMFWHVRQSDENFSSNINYTTKTMFHAYIDGKSVLICIGRKILNLISENKTLFDIRCNDHLFIVKEMKSVHSSMKLPSYDNTYIISDDWSVPVSDINSKEEWSEYLNNNQPDIDSYVDKYSISKNRDVLIKLFGGDLLSEIIQKERNEKLEEILK